MDLLKQMPRHTANLPKTGHEMSQSFGFTSSTGMLLPVYQDFLNPGEKVSFNGNLFSRTQPIVTAAMCDVDVYLDWFFVPASMLYTLLPSLLYMTDDRISSFYTSKDTNRIPLLNVKEALSMDLLGQPMEDSQKLNQVGHGTACDCLGKSHFRLANHLGFNPFSTFGGVTESFGTTDFDYSKESPNVFPMFAYAYQAIYEKHYRIEDREQFDPAFFNADKYCQYSVHSCDANANPFTLRYRPRKNDYFMSLMPSPIMSGVSMLGSVNDSTLSPSTILSKIDNWLSTGDGMNFGINKVAANTLKLGAGAPSYGNSQSIFSGTLGEDVGSVQNFGSNNSSSSYGVLSASNIRSVFAIEKLLRITGRAGKNYDSQVLAHFGWKVPHDVKHEISFLGSDVGLLHIGEVISDADTYDSGSNQGSALGSVGGKGYISIKGKNRKFTAPCHGVIMCIYSSVPRFRYYGGFDKQNSITDRLSFYQPEYDKLGAQPLFGYEADFNYLYPTYADDNTIDYWLGWERRYHQWKQKYDRVSIAFMTPSNASNKLNQYSAWTLASRPYKSGLAYSVFEDNSEVPSRSRFSYYSTPHDLDSIMVMPYSSGFTSAYLASPWLMFATDPFINDFRANVKKVSIMSALGEPDLD